ncbi:uncharacterized protein LOC116410874 [Xenopus tropicalis]|uniref:Uncharacterized protein LOC116410874 n=1 Tax=Xenopus tropicalis TaxID=8364 RepID=A0A8J1JM53_XENTR|nr:uncharacterized protein LOC116410874 [Xenopus tropicalis]
MAAAATNYKLKSHGPSLCDITMKRDINETFYPFCTINEANRYVESFPVCPLSEETTRDVVISQERPRPVPLLLPEDITCDGLLCPIPNRDNQLIKSNEELRSAIIQGMSPIENMNSDAQKEMSIWETLMDIGSPISIFFILLDLCSIYWYVRSKPKKDDDIPANSEAQSKEEQRESLENVESQENRNEKEHEAHRPVGRKKNPHFHRYISPMKEQVCFVTRDQIPRKKPMTKASLDAPVTAVPSHSQTSPPAMAPKEEVKYMIIAVPRYSQTSTPATAPKEEVKAPVTAVPSHSQTSPPAMAPKEEVKTMITAVPRYSQTSPPAMAPKKEVKVNIRNCLYVKLRRFLSCHFPTRF